MRTITVLLLLLAGCATSPAEVRDSGNMLASSSAASPDRTAQCLRRSWERDGEMQAETVPGLKAGSLELRVRQLDFGVIALYDIEPASAQRTAVRMYWRTGFVKDLSKASLDAFLGGCS